MPPAVRWLAALFLLAALLTSPPADAQQTDAQRPAQKIAVHASLTGSGAFSGTALVDAVRMAIDEANATGASPQFEPTIFDDHTTDDGARAAAYQAAATDALVAIGPAVSGVALAACQAYAERGLVLIDASVHADAVTDSATTFRTVISTSEIGAAQANYLARVLHQKQAIVVIRDNAYGQPLAAEFQRAGVRLGLAATYLSFRDDAGRDAAARQILATRDHPPLVLGMTYPDAVPLMTTLRRQGYRGLIVGTATMARASFNELFAGQPEEQRTPGFFTNDTYAVSPIIFDSANAETLAFADRFRARFGRDPSWEQAQGYDAANLAMAAVKSVIAQNPGSSDLAGRRAAVLHFLERLRGPAQALPGLTGPIWFTPGHVRPQAARMGRFHNGLFESAPLQIVAVTHPEPVDIASGAVFEITPGHYARLQRVVTTGISINEITHVDLDTASFGADFYLWQRYATDAGPNAADPTDIRFQNMLDGSFDRAHPSEQVDLADGTVYRLWRIQAEFRNDFDLHRFPFDRQTLSLQYYNNSAAADRIVYVLDRRNAVAAPASVAQSLVTTASVTPASVAQASISTSGAAMAATSVPGATAMDRAPIAAPPAFRKLTQWRPLQATERRQDLVTGSALGDPRRTGAETVRELSGFRVTVDIKRLALATLTKALLPLLLMTVIMFSSLYFPVALVKEKVTVTITAALSGTVFLGRINTQLGGVGYTIAVEYAFYVFFALALLCIISVMLAERQRFAGNRSAAELTEHRTRIVFLLAVAATVASAIWLFASS